MTAADRLKIFSGTTHTGLADEMIYKVLRGNAIEMLSLDRV